MAGKGYIGQIIRKIAPHNPGQGYVAKVVHQLLGKPFDGDMVTWRDWILLEEYPATVTFENPANVFLIEAIRKDLTLTDYEAALQLLLEVEGLTDALVVTAYDALVPLPLEIAAGQDSLTLTRSGFLLTEGGTDLVLQEDGTFRVILEGSIFHTISFNTTAQGTVDALTIAEQPASIGITYNLWVDADRDALSVNDRDAFITAGGSFRIYLENGVDYLLMENGSNYVLQEQAPADSNFDVLLENGTDRLLSEQGDRIIQE